MVDRDPLDHLSANPFEYSFTKQKLLWHEYILFGKMNVWAIMVGDTCIYFTYTKCLNVCWMGPWLVLVSPCFRENVVVTCKIGSFLCSLENLLQKNVIVLFLEIKFQNGAHLKKGLFLTYFSHFLVTRESYQNSFSTYLKHILTRILLTLLTFLSYQFWKI